MLWSPVDRDIRIEISNFRLVKHYFGRFFNVTFYAEVDGLKVLYLEFVLDGATPIRDLFENAKTMKEKMHHES